MNYNELIETITRNTLVDRKPLHRMSDKERSYTHGQIDAIEHIIEIIKHVDRCENSVVVDVQLLRGKRGDDTIEVALTYEDGEVDCQSFPVADIDLAIELHNYHLFKLLSIERPEKADDEEADDDEEANSALVGYGENESDESRFGLHERFFGDLRKNRSDLFKGLT